MDEAPIKFQPIVSTDLSRDEFEDLHLLAALRGDFVQTVVTNLIRKELKFHSQMLEQLKLNSPEIVKQLLNSQRRKKKRIQTDSTSPSNGKKCINDLISLSQESKL